MTEKSTAETARATTESRELFERLQRSLPGGDTRTGTTYAPFPIAFSHGRAHKVWDLDDNDYIDLCNNMTALVHGHAHPEVVQAIAAQAEQGTAFPAPNPFQADVAEMLCERIDSVERVRFTNSGTEAAMLAVRAARAYTGRSRIIKIDGGYHGSWEQVLMSLEVPHGRVGSAQPADAEPESWAAGVPREVSDLATMVEFNNVANLEAAAEEVGEELAAIILEPVLGGGMIPGDPVFFARARELADDLGALLILDEVITARLDWGGYQAVLGVSPDLTVFGKVIGGGLPVGAFGGSESVMGVFDPGAANPVGHAGTFNGNPLTLAAGRTSLELLTADEIARVNALGERLAAGLGGALQEHGIKGAVTGHGSVLHLHFDTRGEIRSFTDMRTTSPRIERFHELALDAGVFLARRGMMCVSTPMTPAIVDETVERCGRALARLSAEG